MTFCEKVMELIEQKGISQRKMLLDLGMNTNSFVNWQKRGTLPTAKNIKKISDYFGVPIEYFINEDNKPNYNILNNILSVMKYKKISQKQVLDELGLSSSAFADWKNGKTASFFRYLPQIAEILGVSEEYLKSNKVIAQNTISRDKLRCKDCGFYIHGLCVRKKLYTPFPPTGFCNYAIARSDSESEQCSKCVKNDICVFKVDNNGECLHFAGNQ